MDKSENLHCWSCSADLRPGFEQFSGECNECEALREGAIQVAIAMLAEGDAGALRELVQ